MDTLPLHPNLSLKEAAANRGITQPTSDELPSKPPRRKRKQPTLQTRHHLYIPPFPLVLFVHLAAMPGKTLALACLIYRFAKVGGYGVRCVSGAVEFRLGNSVLTELDISLRSRTTALLNLQALGLVSVVQRPGAKPVLNLYLDRWDNFDPDLMVEASAGPISK